MTRSSEDSRSRTPAPRHHLARFRRARLRRVAIASAAAAALLAGHAQAAPDQPRCFGAAARDPERQPCDNPSLRRSVVPSPSDAQIEPSARCTPLGGEPDVCAFGAPTTGAAATVALVGDSHAVHWRAPLDAIARGRRWHALTLYRSECPFTTATPRLREPDRSGCLRWARQVVGWFEDHPEVRTVFVSQHSRGGVIAPRGQDPFAARVRGYVDVWRALPASVRRIVVIRDPPYIETGTLSCVRRAMARRSDAGTACALPRSSSLRDDPAVVAAKRVRRAQAIDLSDFMCDPALCYPVVGGVLVKKDAGHLTKRFADTLAPYLGRGLRRLMAGWR